MIIKELSKRQKLKIGEEKNIRNEALVPPTKEKGSALEDPNPLCSNFPRKLFTL